MGLEKHPVLVSVLVSKKLSGLGLGLGLEACGLDYNTGWRNGLKRDINNITAIPDEANEETLSRLEQEKVKDVNRLKTQITEKYKSFMAQVSDICIRVLGKIPCRYALVGMGSMAREEITPFSDFENMILLQEGVQCRKKEDYEQILEYFRWYAVMFQVILINLGETILPSVAIPSLNNFITPGGDWFYDAFTKSGISFDGMMPHACKSPLGRQQILENKPQKTELIKPISQMVQYLDEKEDLKNGYHLAEILSNSCFVSGDQNIYSSFTTKVEEKLSATPEDILEKTTQSIKDDMKKFNFRKCIPKTIADNKCNVKQLIYRSATIFVMGLAKRHKINPGSCFEIVQEMIKRKLILNEFAHKLMYAIAIACEIRLKVYFDQGRQNDSVSPNHKDQDVGLIFRKLIGKQSCKDYFTIASCFQYDVITHFKLRRSFMYFHPITTCIAINSLFDSPDLILAVQSYVQRYPILCHQPEQSMDAKNSISSRCDENEDHQVVFGNWYSQIQCLYSKIEFFKAENAVFDMSCALLTSENVFDVLMDIGKQMYQKEEHLEALDYFCFGNKYVNEDENVTTCRWNQARLCFWKEKCRSSRGEYDTARDDFVNALKLSQVDKESDMSSRGRSFIADCHKELGSCYKNLGDTEEACDTFVTALRAYKSFFMQKSDDVNFCFMNLYICYSDLDMRNEADNALDELLELYSVCNTPSSPVEMLHHNKYCYNMASCHQDIALFCQQHDFHQKALGHLRQALEFFEELSHEVSTGSYIMEVRRLQGRSYQILDKFDEASCCYEKALELSFMVENTQNNMKFKTIADIHRSLGYTLQMNDQTSNGKKHAKKALNIYREIVEREGLKNVSILKEIAACYWDLAKFSEARHFFEEFLDQTSKMEPHELSSRCEKDIAYALKNLGNCWEKEKRWDEAIQYFELSQKKFNSLSKSPKYEVEKALLWNKMGRCKKSNGENEEAKKLFKKAYDCCLDGVKIPRRKFVLALTLENFGHISNTAEHSLKCFEFAIKILSTLSNRSKYQFKRALVLKAMGFSYKNQGEHLKAIGVFKQSIKTFECLPSNHKIEENIGIILKNIGFCYQKECEHEMASSFFKKSLRVFKDLPESEQNCRDIAINFEHLGEAYKARNLDCKGYSCFEKALSIYCNKMPIPAKYWKQIYYLRETIAFSRGRQPFPHNGPV